MNVRVSIFVSNDFLNIRGDVWYACLPKQLACQSSIVFVYILIRYA